MNTQPVTWRFRNATWAVIAKAMMAPAAMSVSDVAVFMVLDPFIKDGCEPGHLGAALFSPRTGSTPAGWRGAVLARAGGFALAGSRWR
jgi:hypothetical protein